ncbi:glycosyltransferase [Dietzia sp. B32]|uniref:glycosyltransferase n=1 Tax=Dietzia sp. B32 TaxID=2915130 RepID=UPI0021AE1DA7|nr:glycosyltransferase [Dietzia sp. B32]UVE93748.1 hypothetical protein L8M95_09185 [Dietzia sp. B32]
MIGVYVHNRGRGHLHRVLPVVAALRDRGEEVTMLVTGPLDDSQRPRGTRVVHLPVEDAPRGRPAGPGPQGPGSLDGPGPEDITLGARRAAVAWIDRVQPRAFWVDSSPGMSLAARMTGTPMVSTLPPGVRDDEPHLLRCRAAERLIGAWPPGVHRETVARTDSRVSEIGGVSRFERRGREPRARRRPRVVHLNASGTDGDHRFWRAVRTTTAELGVADWVELGGPDGEWHEDPWPVLSSADVVVTGAGQASVADAACADVPLVVVPGKHAYGEYDATAEALDSIPGATVMRYGDGPTAVAHAVRKQVDRSLDGEAAGIRTWWGVDGAASRAAEVIRSAVTTTR